MKKTAKTTLFVGCVLAFTIWSAQSFASEDKEFFEYTPEELSYQSVLSPAEIHARTEAVLNYYKVPAEQSSQPNFSDLAGKQNLAGVQGLLKFFDPNKMFPRLFTATNAELKGFDDIDGKSKLDFTVNLDTLSRQIESLRIQELRERLAAFRTANQPLKGLRVAIDPGHMGTTYYDNITGKFVRDNKGNYVSEGVIALQTSLLLKKELTALGAQVELTRETLDKVTDISYENFPVEEFARNELRESIHTPWFQKLLNVGTGQTLFNAFEQSNERKTLFKPGSRYTYFVLRADLWARAEKMNRFNPDVVLIIHYDTLDLPNDPQGVNPKAPSQTKSYVAGAYKAIDFGSRKARMQFARHLLDQTQWDLSIELSRNIVKEFNRQMGLPLTKNTGEGIKVEDGIFARNLNIPRFLDAPAVAYLECLFYNRPEEFYAFANTKYPMNIGGKNYPYSDRLVQVVNSIKQGVLNFTNTF